MSKLSQEEITALISAFDSTPANLKRLADQTRMFRWAYLGVNIYGLFCLTLYIIFEVAFVQKIDSLEGGQYIQIFLSRDFAFVWILGAMNIAFFFGASFRFVVTVGFLFTLNAAIEQIFIIYSVSEMAEMSIVFIYVTSRLFFLFGLLCIGASYRET